MSRRSDEEREDGRLQQQEARRERDRQDRMHRCPGPPEGCARGCPKCSVDPDEELGEDA